MLLHDVQGAERATQATSRSLVSSRNTGLTYPWPRRSQWDLLRHTGDHGIDVEWRDGRRRFGRSGRLLPVSSRRVIVTAAESIARMRSTVCVRSLRTPMAACGIFQPRSSRAFCYRGSRRTGWKPGGQTARRGTAVDYQDENHQPAKVRVRRCESRLAIHWRLFGSAVEKMCCSGSCTTPWVQLVTALSGHGSGRWATLAPVPRDTRTCERSSTTAHGHRCLCPDLYVKPYGDGDPADAGNVD